MDEDKKTFEQDVLFMKDFSPVDEGIKAEDEKTKEQKDIENEKKIRREICQRAQAQLSQNVQKVLCINGEKGKDYPKVFKSFNDGYWTDRYVGILYFDDSEDTQKVYKIQIGSRFDTNNQQYFLNYVFSRAFGVDGKIFEDMQILSNPELCWDLPLIVQYFQLLKKALRVGYYKEYVTYYCNDSKMNGVVDIPRHIKENILFSGKIAYNRRENTPDNDINRLVLLTYQYIQKKYPALARTFVNDSLKRKIQQMQNMAAWDGMPDVSAILSRTSKPVTCHLFEDYESLRKLCRLILHHRGANIMDTQKTKISGVLIDMTKLWEDFLHVSVLEKNGFAAQSEYSFLFENESREGKRKIKPDFVYVDGQMNAVRVVLDAKYKIHWSDGIGHESLREDIFQVMAYMLAMDCSHGGVVFPMQTDTEQAGKQYQISEFCDRQFYCFPVKIPKSKNSFAEFKREMDENLKILAEEKIQIIWNEQDET